MSYILTRSLMIASAALLLNGCDDKVECNKGVSYEYIIDSRGDPELMTSRMQYRWSQANILFALMGDDPFMLNSPIATDQSERLDAGIRITILEKLPDKVSIYVMLAIVDLLDDQREGQVGTVKHGVIRSEMIDKSVGIVRDVALKQLIEKTGVDMGYDKNKWRQWLYDNRSKFPTTLVD